jgi:hypothetical protein
MYSTVYTCLLYRFDIKYLFKPSNSANIRFNPTRLKIHLLINTRFLEM